VRGASIQIVHYFDHGYLEEEKSMIHSLTVKFHTMITNIIVYIYFMPVQGTVKTMDPK
jgi:hypothetical protein